MADFSRVPGLSGYQQQVALNDQQSMQGLNTLGSLLNMKRLQQQMQQEAQRAAYEPEDRAMKQRLLGSQIAENEAQAAARQTTAQRAMQAFDMAKRISAMPDGPEKQQAVMQYRAFVKPESAFEDQKTAPLPWYVRKGPAGETSIDPAYAAFEKAKAGAGRPTTPYYTPIPTAEGLGRFNNRSGQFELIPGVVKSSDSPELQGRIAGAKAGGKELGESGAKAQVNLPTAVATAEQSIKQIDELLKHPGFESTVGMTLLPGARFVEGSPQADFMARLDQIKGGAFLEAFNTLKGGGQITEVEGKKATQAITRMDKAQSEAEFTRAANDFKAVVSAGVTRAKAKAGAAQPAAGSAKPSLSEWMAKARAANPSASGAELEAYYYKKYGAK